MESASESERNRNNMAPSTEEFKEGVPPPGMGLKEGRSYDNMSSSGRYEDSRGGDGGNSNPPQYNNSRDNRGMGRGGMRDEQSGRYGGRGRGSRGFRGGRYRGRGGGGGGDFHH